MRLRLAQPLVAGLTSMTLAACVGTPDAVRWRTGWVHQIVPTVTRDIATLPCAGAAQPDHPAAVQVAIIDVAHLRAKRRVALAVPEHSALQPGARVQVDVAHCMLRVNPAG